MMMTTSTRIIRKLPSLYSTSLVLCLVCHLLGLCGSFPQGAPPEVCEMLSPRRGHKSISQPAFLSPFYLIQYGRSYSPRQVIAVELLPKHADSVFKGFALQALDPTTLEFIGHFLPGEGLRLLPECSAVTHSDANPKSSASFLWVAPQHRQGQVLFRATVVENKLKYYENILGQLAPTQHSATW